MADADLEEIRKARLQQLRQQQGSSGGGEGGQEDQQRQREADARSSILAQILLPEAADRLGRIRLVKESRAVDVENRLIMLARSGQLRQKVTEEQLKEMLNSLSEQQKEQEKPVVTVRWKGGWDDDDDLDDLLNS
ncbi:hypothetical protein H2201_006960 [Coniosporium apollinis]|uniref:Programmed cell death protein 5 n=1 Tax=Coniosporium apollinis TaxID=61459 RepID=A0ABQ9NKQ6_9PEZI|nr:hypothetical protein H2201_006960 [Coniosporium apollinis]